MGAFLGHCGGCTRVFGLAVLAVRRLLFCVWGYCGTGRSGSVVCCRRCRRQTVSPMGSGNEPEVTLFSIMGEEAGMEGVSRAEPRHLFLASIRIQQWATGASATGDATLQVIRAALGCDGGKVSRVVGNAVPWDSWTPGIVVLIDEADAAYGRGPAQCSREVIPRRIVSRFLCRAGVRRALRDHSVQVEKIQKEYGTNESRRSWPIYVVRAWSRYRWRLWQYKHQREVCGRGDGAGS